MRERRFPGHTRRLRDGIPVSGPMSERFELEDIGRRIPQIQRLHKLVGLQDRSPTLLTAVTGLVTSHGRQSPASRHWGLAVEGGKTSRSASVRPFCDAVTNPWPAPMPPGAVQTAVALTSSAAGPFGVGSCGTSGCCPIAARGIVRLESTTAVGVAPRTHGSAPPTYRRTTG
jgi:hypothetical protein